MVSMPITTQLSATTQLPTTTQPPSTTATPETTIAEVTTSTVVVSPIEAARGTLSAWGRFAVGDLDRLDGFFHQNGPQWRQLAAEAETLAEEPPGPPRYTVTLLTTPGRRDGPRPGCGPGPGDLRPTWRDQGYRWDVVMVPGGNGAMVAVDCGRQGMIVPVVRRVIDR